MRLLESFLGLSALAVVRTMPTSTLETSNDYTWSVSGWSAGCARRGCYYDFNITLPEYDELPALNAYCSGIENVELPNYGVDFRACKLREGLSEGIEVAAKLKNRTSPGTFSRDIIVRLQIAEDGYNTTYIGTTNITYNQFLAPAMNFTIRPLEA